VGVFKNRGAGRVHGHRTQNAPGRVRQTTSTMDRVDFPCRPGEIELGMAVWQNAVTCEIRPNDWAASASGFECERRVLLHGAIPRHLRYVGAGVVENQPELELPNVVHFGATPVRVDFL